MNIEYSTLLQKDDDVRKAASKIIIIQTFISSRHQKTRKKSHSSLKSFSAAVIKKSLRKRERVRFQNFNIAHIVENISTKSISIANSNSLRRSQRIKDLMHDSSRLHKKSATLRFWRSRKLTKLLKLTDSSKYWKTTQKSLSELVKTRSERIIKRSERLDFRSTL
jgi:hypothetical protein